MRLIYVVSKTTTSRDGHILGSEKRHRQGLTRFPLIKGDVLDHPLHGGDSTVTSIRQVMHYGSSAHTEQINYVGKPGDASTFLIKFAFDRITGSQEFDGESIGTTFDSVRRLRFSGDIDANFVISVYAKFIQLLIRVPQQVSQF